MRRVTVRRGRTAVVKRNGVYRKVLQNGKFWVSALDRVKFYSNDILYTAEPNADELTDLDESSDLLRIHSVQENEVLIVANEGRVEAVLEKGKYDCFFERDVIKTYLFNKMELNFDDAIPRNLLDSPMLSSYVHSIQVSPDKRVIVKSARGTEVLGPGVHYLISGKLLKELRMVELKPQLLEMSGQEMLTSDKVTIRLNLNAVAQVEDISKVNDLSEDWKKDVYVQIQSALRSVVSGLSLDDLLSRKVQVGEEVLALTRGPAEARGAVILEVKVKDVILPGEIREIMNKVLVAEKQAQANVIMRREETASTRSLLNTAKLMENHPTLFKLKEMEFMERVAGAVNELKVSGQSLGLEELKKVLLGDE
ncbi:MAG: slipin family protein [Flavobacteriales bacterium]|nr:slipin family protein [Flavobacteriales bacterium]